MRLCREILSYLFNQFNFQILDLHLRTWLWLSLVCAQQNLHGEVDEWNYMKTYILKSFFFFNILWGFYHFSHFFLLFYIWFFALLSLLELVLSLFLVLIVYYYHLVPSINIITIIYQVKYYYNLSFVSPILFPLNNVFYLLVFNFN